MIHPLVWAELQGAAAGLRQGGAQPLPLLGTAHLLPSRGAGGLGWVPDQRAGLAGRAGDTAGEPPCLLRQLLLPHL